VHKWKKRKKYGFIYDTFNNINKGRTSMSFLHFHWKYFIMFLGLKMRNKLLR
jgi:hypothetical protein